MTKASTLTKTPTRCQCPTCTNQPKLIEECGVCQVEGQRICPTHNCYAGVYDEDDRMIVHDLLDAALANGYVNMLKGPPDEIADDMHAFSDEVWDWNPERLIPHIVSWQAKHKDDV